MPVVSGNVGAVFNGGTITTALVPTAGIHGAQGGSISFPTDGADNDVVVKISTADGTLFAVEDENGFTFIEAAGGFLVSLSAPAVGAGVVITSNTGTTVIQVDPAGQLGFYNHATTALQTGVPVSAAGIHAALVNLGLITA